MSHKLVLTSVDVWKLHCFPRQRRRRLSWMAFHSVEQGTEGAGRGGAVVRSGRCYNPCRLVDCVWNVMTHAQKPDFVFRRNGQVHLNRPGIVSLAAEVCASAVVMLDTPCSEVVWRVLATHCFRQLPLHFPSRASPCAITFEMDSTFW